MKFETEMQLVVLLTSKIIPNILNDSELVNTNSEISTKNCPGGSDDALKS